MDGDTGFSNLVCLESLILGRNRSCVGSVKTQFPADVKPLAFIEGQAFIELRQRRRGHFQTSPATCYGEGFCFRH